jgi:tRNA G18 (ribose-2'-O)-methylase SpoU
MAPKKDIYLILHNIRSLHNVGSIFRTADAAGMKKIYLTGYTPSPTDRFGKIRPEIKKTALGAESAVEWKKYKDIGKLIVKLKENRSPLGERFSLVAVEQAANSIN